MQNPNNTNAERYHASQARLSTPTQLLESGQLSELLNAMWNFNGLRLNHAMSLLIVAALIMLIVCTITAIYWIGMLAIGNETSLIHASYKLMTALLGVAGCLLVVLRSGSVHVSPILLVVLALGSAAYPALDLDQPGYMGVGIALAGLVVALQWGTRAGLSFNVVIHLLVGFSVYYYLVGLPPDDGTTLTANRTELPSSDIDNTVLLNHMMNIALSCAWSVMIMFVGNGVLIGARETAAGADLEAQKVEELTAFQGWLMECLESAQGKKIAAIQAMAAGPFSGEALTEIRKLAAEMQQGVSNTEQQETSYSNLERVTTSDDVATAPNEEKPLANFSILFVEDDIVSQRISTLLLTNLGAHVDTVTNGVDALMKLFSNHNYDVILSDVAMPQMDGMSLLHALKQKKEQAPPLAFCTGSLTAVQSSEAKLAGAIAIYPKPMSRARALALHGLVMSQRQGQPHGNTAETNSPAGTTDQ